MTDTELETLIESYCYKLAPLFECSGDRFDYVLALLRASGHEGAGWDTLAESFRTLDDLHFLAMAELPNEYFKEPDITRLRLRLLEYCHLVEMAAPYDIIANLCRVKLGLPVSNSPFVSPAKKGLPNGSVKKAKTPSKHQYPPQKIDVIKSLTKEVGLPAIGVAFDDFYRREIRNAINHSDYVIHCDEFRMRSDTIASEDSSNSRTSIVKLDRLLGLINNARAFYLAFVRVEKGVRLTVGKNKGRGFPYDNQYKGILEVLTDEEDYLCGAIIHWPNGLESRYVRTKEGSQPVNILPRDGELQTFVGEVHSPHDPFSPLLKPGQLAKYTLLKGSSEPLRWDWE